MLDIILYYKKFSSQLVFFSDLKALLEDMEMRQTALQSIKSTAEDLIKQAGSDQDDAVRGEFNFPSWFFYFLEGKVLNLLMMSQG